MNTQLEFDEENLYCGDDEMFFRNNGVNNLYWYDICKEKVFNILKKSANKISNLESQNRELKQKILLVEEINSKTSKRLKEVLDELEDIERVCFKNSNFPIPNNSIAFRIRKRLIEIKLELNNKVKIKQKQAYDWQNLAVDMLYFVGLKSRTKLGKSLLKRYHFLINKYPPKSLEESILT